MTSESLEEIDLCLPLLSTEKGDASFLEEDLSSYSCNKTAEVAFTVWALTATIVLSLLTLGDAWDDIVANTKDIFQDLRSNWQADGFGFGHDSAISDSNVMQLDDTHWDEFHEGHSAVFVNFHLAGRPDSSKLSPVWEQLANYMKMQTDSPVGIATVNCVDHRDLCRRESVSTYPTLRWYEGGRAVGDDYFPGGGTTFEYVKKLANQRLSGPRMEDTATTRQESLEVFTSNDGPESAVADLTMTNFKPWLLENEMAFVDLYAPWCVWCQRLAPTWERFAQEAQRLNMPIGIGKVDCMAQGDLCRSEEIMAFPTFRWYQKSEATKPDYTMDRPHRTVQALLTYAQNKLGGVLVDEPSYALENQEKEVARSFPAMTTTSSYPKEVGEEREGNREELEIPQLAIHLDKESWANFHKSHNAVLVDFYAPWCVWSQRLSPIWDQFAQEVAERELPISIVKVDCVAQENLCRRERVFAFPTVQWYEGGRATGLSCTEERSVEAYLNYAYLRLSGISGEAEDEMTPTMQEGGILLPNDQEGDQGDSFEGLHPLNFAEENVEIDDDHADNVEIEDDDEILPVRQALKSEDEPVLFHSIDITEPLWKEILETSPDAFIVFGATLSQRAQAVWEEFAEQARAINLPVAIARVDCVAEDQLCLRERIYAYPTMRWYKNGASVFSYTCENDPNCHEQATSETLLAYANELLSDVEEQEDVFTTE